MRITPGNDVNIPQKTVVSGRGEATRNGQALRADATAQNAGGAAYAGLGIQRSVAEALTIAHTASSLINKALSISSQLQNIAQQAISTGNVDNAEVSRTISEINISMSQATGQPVFAVIPPAVGGGNREPVRMEVPSARNELDTLGRIASTIDAGGTIGDGPIGEVRNSLSRKAAAVGDIIGSIEGSVQGAAVGAAIEEPAGAERTARVLAERISSEPVRAISAQGNVRPENVAGYLS